MGTNGGIVRMRPGDLLLEPEQSTLLIISEDSYAALAVWIEPNRSASIVHVTSIPSGSRIVQAR